MVSLESVGARQVYFEQTITRLVTYWCEHEAVKNVDAEFLDEEKDNILKLISVALDVPQAWSRTIDLIMAFDLYYERRVLLEDWYRLLSKALEVAKERKDIDNEVLLTKFLADFHNLKNDYKKCASLYWRAIRLSKKTPKSLAVKGLACANLAFALNSRGQFRRSEILLCHALKIYVDLDSPKGIGHIHYTLGFVYMRQEKFEESERHHKKAIQIFEDMNDDFKLIGAYGTFGHLLIETKQAEEALTYFYKALDKAEVAGATKVRAGSIYLNIGYTHLTQCDLSQAEQYLKKAEKMFQANPDTEAWDLAQVPRHMGEVYEAKEDYAQAVEYFELALQRFQAIGHKQNEAWIMTLLAKCQILLNDLASARKTIQQIESLIGKLDKELKQKISSAIEKFYAAMNNKAAYETLKNEYTYRKNNDKNQTSNES